MKKIKHDADNGVYHLSDIRLYREHFWQKCIHINDVIIIPLDRLTKEPLFDDINSRKYVDYGKWNAVYAW